MPAVPTVGVQYTVGTGVCDVSGASVRDLHGCCAYRTDVGLYIHREHRRLGDCRMRADKELIIDSLKFEGRVNADIDTSKHKSGIDRLITSVRVGLATGTT